MAVLTFMKGKSNHINCHPPEGRIWASLFMA